MSKHKRMNKHKKCRAFSNKASKMQRSVASIITIFGGVLILFLPLVYSYIQGQYLVWSKPNIILFVTKAMYTAGYPFSIMFFLI